MRSDLVYRASDKVANRFQLCRLASSSARSMIQSSVGMHITINKALEAISGHSAPIVVAAPRVEAMKAANEVIVPPFILDPAI